MTTIQFSYFCAAELQSIAKIAAQGSLRGASTNPDLSGRGNPGEAGDCLASLAMTVSIE